MLTRLLIENFQAHEKLSVKLAPITTFVGPTDSGKSSVLRALKFCVCNDARGQSYVRDGADFARVKLQIDNHVIERVKGNGINQYRIDNDLFKAFGASVPDPVASLLNLQTSNFQGQHDSPFWLADSAGSVGRQLNAVVDLDCIDSDQKVVARALRQSSAELQAIENQRLVAQARNDALVPYESLDAGCSKVMHSVGDLLRVCDSVDLLRQLVEDLRVCSPVVGLDAVELISDVDTCFSVYDAAQAKFERVLRALAGISSLVDMLRDVLVDAESAEKELDAIAYQIDVIAACDVCGRKF